MRTRWAILTNCAVSRISSVRSRGRSHSMTSMMRPGRGDMTTILVDRNIASGIEWVTKITVAQQLLVEMVADNLVERTEGLIHEQQRGIE